MTLHPAIIKQVKYSAETESTRFSGDFCMALNEGVKERLPELFDDNFVQHAPTCIYTANGNLKEDELLKEPNVLPQVVLSARTKLWQTSYNNDVIMEIKDRVPRENAVSELTNYLLTGVCAEMKEYFNQYIDGIKICWYQPIVVRYVYFPDTDRVSAQLSSRFAIFHPAQLNCNYNQSAGPNLIRPNP